MSTEAAPDRIVVPPLLRPDRLAAVADTGLLDTGPEEAFDRLARLAATLLDAPYAFVTVVDETRSFWKSCIGVDAAALADRQNLVEESFCQYVIATDEPLIVGDTRANEMTRDNPSIEKMGALAWAGHPLRSIDGFTLGTFCVVDTVAREWTPPQLEILESLAAAIEGEIRLRSLLDASTATAVITRREMLVRARLAKLAEQLATADSTDAVSTSITDLGPDVLGASIVTLGLVDQTRRQLIVHGEVAEDAVLGPLYSSVSLNEHLPIVDAVRRREAVYLRSLNEIDERYPQVVDAVGRLGLTATASIPLLHSDGAVIGALTIGWPTTAAFDATDRAMVKTVALLCAQSIERAQLGDFRRELVESLQRELLPEIPDLPGLATAVRYFPANSGIGFGGDWYDIIDLPDGRAVVVVGDIVGHGIQAAARMSQVRGAINALTRMYADDLPSVIVEAELILSHLHDGYIATLVVFLIDPVRGTIDYVSAGHPPAVMVTRDGAATLLDSGRGTVLGSGRSRTDTGSSDFPPGAVLVAFTDGLVERRDQTTDTGTDRIVAVISEAAERGASGLEPEWLADRIVSELIGARFVTDDVALVVVRRADAPD